ncbi:hypothetical protein [Mycobacterium antarcticum]|uniref:hypothetical protein n=1 Tax=Mycolicibacterium sp. TUM20984 TaxID=3023368 RepID=UPI002390F842|nr:hypothetical protein [Mycolicibacterium sp. TUM20984]GLP82109.1 hypothetical protein TUM20984_35290 [Mycolicibacterium sp. TUM20984]
MLADPIPDSVRRDGAISRAPAWFSPGVFIVAPVGLSFLAWFALTTRQHYGRAQTNPEALNGFSIPAEVSSRGIGLLLLWYGAIIGVSTVGFWLGTHRSRAVDANAPTNTDWFERRYFFIVVAAGAIGIGDAFLKVGGIAAIVDSLSEQTANDFSNSLSGFAGLQTLRYANILAAPIGVYLWRKKIIGWPWMAVAVLLLGTNAMITSRLSLLMASAVYVAMSVRGREPRPAMPGSRARTYSVVALVILSGFAVLTALNYSRNANYYREAGVSNPVAMNLYQSGAYLAVPAQVSLGVSDAVGRGAWEKPGDPVTALGAVMPTFLQFNKVAKDDSFKQASVYGFSVTFAGNFFTNSVFADTYSVYGTWGWLYTILAYGVAGYAFARIYSLSPVVAASSGVVAYCFLEVWRVQILTYGIVVFLLLLTAAAAWAAARLRPPRTAAAQPN